MFSIEETVERALLFLVLRTYCEDLRGDTTFDLLVPPDAAEFPTGSSSGVPKSWELFSQFSVPGRTLKRGGVF